MTGSDPALTRWGHTWRLLVMLAISGVASIDWGSRFVAHAWWLPLDLAIGLACLVLVQWRRRHPVTVAVVTNLAATFFFSPAGPSALALVSLATRRRWREIVPVALFLLATTPFILWMSPDTGTDPRIEAGFVVVLLGSMLGWGLYIGSRRELLATLRSRAEIAEAEQSAKVAGARSAERTRIAREMHDVLAHRISLVTMHAGALAYRQDLPASQVRETAQTIQDTAHQALRELRLILGVLREGPGDSTPEMPQPEAQDIPALIDEARAAGMRITCTVSGPLDAVPPGAGRTVFRVVQEGLTNARRHAPDTTVTVSVAAVLDDRITVVVDNPLRIGMESELSGSGLGLPGLAERLALVGGTLEHDVTADRRFRLTAQLPWRE